MNNIPAATKKDLMAFAITADQDRITHERSLIGICTILFYVLKAFVLLQTITKGPDRNTAMCSLPVWPC